ncbi:universal stress protein [Massilia sp. Leaf139]|uniref:universal stress protein n=1 Tax=Massilia sp. Leaf139 TaxID=1736272 RepID=UPI0006FBC090|nr:universal stress protein [Massilia sp. Leaf139]KQQ97435.1 sulfate transporter [Massilia sp. Leaf139]
MFKRILLPTDGSELSSRAGLAGVSFAKEAGAQVIGMTALPGYKTFTANADMIESTEDEYLAASEARAGKWLAAVSDAARDAGVECATVLVRADDPHEAILRTARDRGCDLIVMASHGRRGLGGLLLGSETQKVLVHSSIPVLVYR